MADSNSTPPEDSNLAAIRRMSEQAFRVGPDGYGEERLKLEKEYRREQVQKTFGQAAGLILGGIALYFVWTRTGVSRWLPGLVSRLFNWTFGLVGILVDAAAVGLTFWMVAHKDETSEG